jgi:hypothetical protein
MTNKVPTQNRALCPDCGERVTVRGSIRIGLEVICPHCDAVLQVIDVDPVELDWAYEDDWEDDEEWDDEDEEDEDEDEENEDW